MADNLLSSFLPDDRASFGIFPQMKPKRRFQDREASANVPLSALRGYVAGTAGLPGDIEGLARAGLSQLPPQLLTAFPALRAFGIGSRADPTPQLPTTEFYNEYLPGASLNETPTGKAFTTAGNLLGGVGSTNIAGLGVKGAAAGVKALGPTAGRMAEGYLQRQGLMPNIVPEAPQVPLGSMIEKPQAPVSPLGFYSATEQAALNLPRKSGTGESFLNDLMKGQDVKKDELSWMGLDDYLKGKPNVTRQEVQDFIASNRVDVQERQLGVAVAEDPVGIAQRKAVFDKYEPEIQDLYRRIDKPEYVVYDPETNKVLKNYTNYDDALLDNLNPMGAFSKARTGLRPKENSRQLQAQLTDLQTARDAEANAAYVIPEPTPTRYQNYQLPGGENYREILLTLPFKEPPMPRGYGVSSVQYEDGTRKYFAETPTSRSQGFKTQEEAQSALAKTAANLKGFRQNLEAYKSSHFNEPNILAHMRVNDRVDADGKKMLLIEEIQSDWHQAGREKGYIGNYAKGDVKPYTPERAKAEFGLPNTDLFWYFEVPGNTLQIPKSRFGTQDKAMNYVLTEKKVNPEGVPDAPFKDTWHQLALKRALKYAADNGYDRVGLTTGRQQVDRYTNEMRQNVDELQFFPIGNQNNILISAKKGGKQTFSGTVADGKFIDGPAEGKTVTEVLGKSMAKQIAEKKDGVIKGDDLTIGGEGMKAYYDEIYPAFLAKQGKKYNAKTGETTIGKKGTIEKSGRSYYQTPDTNATVRYIDISPEMKGGVKKGQPLFTAAPIGGIGVGAGMQDQQQNSLNSFIQ